MCILFKFKCIQKFVTEVPRCALACDPPAVSAPVPGWLQSYGCCMQSEVHSAGNGDRQKPNLSIM